MAKINVVSEMLDKHTEAEIIDYVYHLMININKNYTIAQKEKNTDILWINLGDIQQVNAILGAMHKRNQERQAQ